MPFTGQTMTGGLLAKQAQGDPFFQQRLQAQYAPQAWNIAQQMQQPGISAMQGLFGDKEWMQGIEGAVGALAQRAQAPHPGMPDPSYQEALRALQGQTQQQYAGLGGQMAAFGGSLDPEAFMHASQAVRGGEQRALMGLQAKRSQMDMQAMTQAVGALQPYYREQSRMAQNIYGDIAQTAGGITRGGAYTLPRTSFQLSGPQTWPVQKQWRQG